MTLKLRPKGKGNKKHEIKCANCGNVGWIYHNGEYVQKAIYFEIISFDEPADGIKCTLCDQEYQVIL